jgi:hypothetical protein
VTIAAPLAGIVRCNNVVVPSGDENAVRTPSADNGGFAGGGPDISARRVSDLCPGV